MAEYTLKPVADIPGRLRGGSSLYKNILEDFAKSSQKTVEVIVEGRKPATLYQGLLKANKDADLGIKVVQRANAVYLTK